MGSLRLRGAKLGSWLDSQGGSGRRHFDVVLIGAGFAGLFCGRRLTQLGYRVLLLEASPTALSGASSRNEGWLHAGTYHAVSIKDPQEADAVARRCLYGHRQVLSEFPECVELDESPAIAVVRSDTHDETLDRWERARVAFRTPTAAEVSSLRAHVTVEDDERLYVVADAGIDVRILGARLVAEIRLRGGLVAAGQPVLAQGEVGSPSTPVTFDRLVIAAGYHTPQVCEHLSMTPPPIRLWRSHLLSGPLLAPASVFGLERGQAAMVNHGTWSIVGLNQDAELVPEPTSEPDPVIEAQLRHAAARRFPRARTADLRVTACVKVDQAIDATTPRSLMLSARKVDAEAYVVFPGKMTEAPYTADYIARLMLSDIGHADVPDRLIDTLPVAGAFP